MKKLKLNSLSSESLSEKETQKIKGGNCCGCSCWAASKGGSSSNNNGRANASGRIMHSQKGINDLYDENGPFSFPKRG